MNNECASSVDFKMRVNTLTSEYLCKCKLLAEFEFNKLQFVTLIYETYVNTLDFYSCSRLN